MNGYNRESEQMWSVQMKILQVYNNDVRQESAGRNFEQIALCVFFLILYYLHSYPKDQERCLFSCSMKQDTLFMESNNQRNCSDVEI